MCIIQQNVFVISFLFNFTIKYVYVTLMFKFISQVLSAPLFLWCVVGFRCSYYVWRSAENK